MKREDKELLLKDLSARLLYRVICHIEIHHMFTEYAEKGDFPLNSISIKDSKCDFITCWGIDIDYVRPYLRPLTSMTEGERQEYNKFNDFGSANLRRYEYEDFILYIPSFERVDWLNSHHFDYRGLIPMGLALEAKEGMYD